MYNNSFIINKKSAELDGVVSFYAAACTWVVGSTAAGQHRIMTIKKPIITTAEDIYEWAHYTQH